MKTPINTLKARLMLIRAKRLNLGAIWTTDGQLIDIKQLELLLAKQ